MPLRITKHTMLQACSAALLALLLGSVAHAQSNGDALCQDGTQDIAACEKERRATQHNEPVDPNQDFGANALRRCQIHVNDPEARQACEDRMRGQNTRTEGSISGGGIFQEQRIPQTESARPLQ